MNKPKKENPEDLIKKAEKLVHPNLFSAIFKHKDIRISEAKNLYTEACNIYKMSKEYEKAAECMLKVGELTEIEKFNPSSIYYEAVLLYSKTNNTKLYKSTLEKCVKSFVENNQYIQAGKMKYEQGKNEELNNNFKAAYDCYENSLELFSMDKEVSDSQIIPCKIAKADLIIMHDEFQQKNDALHLYEEICNFYENAEHGKIFAKDFYVKIVLYRLLFDDYLSARSFLHKFSGKDSEFGSSKVCSFLENIIKCFSEISLENGENVGEVLAKFKIEIKNDKNVFTDWFIYMMNKIKIKFDGEVNEGRKNFADEEDLR